MRHLPLHKGASLPRVAWTSNWEAELPTKHAIKHKQTSSWRDAARVVRINVGLSKPLPLTKLPISPVTSASNVFGMSFSSMWSAVAAVWQLAMLTNERLCSLTHPTQASQNRLRLFQKSLKVERATGQRGSICVALHFLSLYSEWLTTTTEKSWKTKPEKNNFVWDVNLLPENFTKPAP